MKNFIELQDRVGESVFVNVKLIGSIIPQCGGGCFIQTSLDGSGPVVMESSKTVWNLIHELTKPENITK